MFKKLRLKLPAIKLLAKYMIVECRKCAGQNGEKYWEEPKTEFVYSRKNKVYITTLQI